MGQVVDQTCMNVSIDRIFVFRTRPYPNMMLEGVRVETNSKGDIRGFYHVLLINEMNSETLVKFDVCVS